MYCGICVEVCPFDALFWSPEYEYSEARIGDLLVLFLFGIMLTRAPIGRDVGLDNDQRWLAALVGALLLGVITYVANDAFGSDKIDFGRIAGAGHTTPSIA